MVAEATGWQDNGKYLGVGASLSNVSSTNFWFTLFHTCNLGNCSFVYWPQHVLQVLFWFPVRANETYLNSWRPLLQKEWRSEAERVKCLIEMRHQNPSNLDSTWAEEFDRFKKKKKRPGRLCAVCALTPSPIKLEALSCGPCLFWFIFLELTSESWKLQRLKMHAPACLV